MVVYGFETKNVSVILLKEKQEKVYIVYIRNKTVRTGKGGEEP